MRRAIWLFVCLAASMFAVAAEDIYVPPSLEEWRDWVLEKHDRHACPVVGGGGRECAWPGRLRFDVNEDRADFSQSVTLYADGWFLLPGGAGFWPQTVTVNDIATPVVSREGRPAVWLTRGSHRITGRLPWTRPPDTLALPPDTGLVALSVAGADVPRPRWNAGQLWIAGGQEATGQQAADAISVSVYRTITDGAPSYMLATLRIDVSGDSREEVIGRLAPEGYSPASLSAPLPARIDNDGRLRIQARPGSWTFVFEARTPGPLDTLTFQPVGEHWPDEEVWSFAADPALRIVEATAPTPVDPIQSGVPDAARDLPAFRMLAGDELRIIERQRGPYADEQDRLTLARELWLDFDRAGYSVRDRIQGQMVNEWRLDLAGPYALQSASVPARGGTENLLVTANPDDDALRGVEIRSPGVDLTALARVDGFRTALPVSGWQNRFDSVTTQLYLPPGQRLLYVGGVDVDRGSWASRWDLLDFFLVLVLTVALARMYSWWLGGVALLALTLGIHETGAPVWTWLNLAVAVALARYLPEGRALKAARFYRLASIGLLLVVLLPFAADQLRQAVFPQLAWGTGGPRAYTAPSAVQMERAAPDAVSEIVVTGAAREEAVLAVPKSDAATQRARSTRFNRYDVSARLQTGLGIPNWGWRSHTLRWSGPVDATQGARLWIAPAWGMTLWRIAMVALMLATLAGLMRRVTPGPPSARPGAALLIAVLAIGAVTLGVLPSSTAQTPDPELLQELEQRLTAEPECRPDCVSIARAIVRYDAQRLSVDLIAHSQATAVVEVPGSSSGWHPQRVFIDGSESESLRRLGNGHFALAVDEGVHRIRLQGDLPNAATVALAFPEVPHYVELEGSGWESSGIVDNRLTGGAVTLLRQRSEQDSVTLDAIDVEQFPAFVTVNRVLSFDLDWEVITTVTRLTPETAAINLAVPLLPGESVTSEGVETENDAVVVNLATGESRLHWRSTLERAPQLVLRAEPDRPWQEHWILRAGASWRLQYSGVPEVVVDRGSAVWQARFLPWPGEALTLALSRPAPVEGPTVAIDEASLHQAVGRRSSEHTLTFRYRATRGDQHAVTLPPDSELSSVSSDGTTLTLSLDDGRLRLPLTPGMHTVQVTWRSPIGVDLYTATGQPDLGISASNVVTSLSLSRDRWILWTNGPLLGPAVLYWTELLVLVLAALVLARFVASPLRFGHWLLLGLGFSTFFWPAFAIVAATFFVLAWRRRNAPDNPRLFNLVQAGIVGLVVAAAAAFVTTIPLGLLGTPDMHISGNGSNARRLAWFIDQSEGVFPAAGAISAPLWAYKALILAWALWAAFALLRWLPWMWSSFSHGGYWKAKRTLLASTREDGDSTADR